jgi:hypothetical protein
VSEAGASRARGECGAALILAIAFLVVIGGIAAAVVSSVTSGLSDRKVLDTARDREYAADGAVDYAIAKVRGLAAPGPGLADCGAATQGVFTISPPAPSLNNVNIRVDCANQPETTVALLLLRDVLFTACVDTGTPCTDAAAIVRAQVNYEGVLSGRVIVQSWSVNR